MSHSHVDNRQAVALKQWLAEQRPELANEIFLDIDPKTGLSLGWEWKGQLLQANSLCEWLICLVSRDWDASPECQLEFRMAESCGKHILVTRLDDSADRTSAWQRCDLFADGAQTEIEVPASPPAVPAGPPVQFNTAALYQILRAIEGSGIGPGNFVWPPSDDPNRAPYRGWDPFEDIDAGVFFGRDAATAVGLAKLRGMRFPPLGETSGRESLFVVLGPSGSGKSSFLRAGLIPRLQRDDRDFMVLGSMRPERAALTGDHGLAAAIDTARRALRLPGTPLGDIKEACRGDDPGPLSELFYDLLAQVRAAAAQRLVDPGHDSDPAAARPPDAGHQDGTAPQRPAVTDQAGDAATEQLAAESTKKSLAPTLVLPLDQAEELFPAEKGTEAARFLALIAELLAKFNATEVGLIVAVTIRTDRYDKMQTNPALRGIGTVPFTELTPMPPSEFNEVINGPAARATQAGHPLTIDAVLRQQLITDASGGAVTLPLLALTLDRLYRDYASTGTLTLEQYNQMGGMRNVVNNEIEQILKRDPHDGTTALALLRSAFIPWLVTINRDTNKPMRRVALESDLPQDSRPLINELVNNRLLVSDERDGQVLVEVALESLFEHWDALKGWLAEQSEDLKTADDIKREASDWTTHDHDPTWLLGSTRLASAEKLAKTSVFSEDLADTRDFLAASRHAEDKKTRIQREVFAVTAIVAIIAIVAALAFFSQRNNARQEALKATAQSLAAEALGMINGDKPGGDERAVQQLLATDVISDHATADDLVAAAVKLAWPSKLISVPNVVDETAAYSPDGALVASGGSDHRIRIWDADTGAQKAVLTGLTSIVTGVAFSPDNQRVVASSDNGELRLWDVANGQQPIASATVPHDPTNIARHYPVAFSNDGELIASRGSGNDVQLWDGATLRPGRALTGHKDVIFGVAFSPAAHLLASASRDGTVRLWNTDNSQGQGLALPGPDPAEDSFQAVSFSGNGHTLAAGSDTSAIWVWDSVDGSDPTPRPIIDNKGPHVHTAQNSSVTSVALSDDGQVLFSGGRNGTIRAWVWDDQGAGSISLQPPRPGDQVQTVAFRPRPAMGLQFMSCSAAGGLRLWSDLRKVVGLTPQSAPVNVVAFSPDGVHAASGSDDSKVRRFDLTTGDHDDGLRATKPVTWIAYGARGARLIASSSDGKIYVWDAATGQPTGAKVINTTTMSVNAVAYSPTEARIVSADADNNLRMWNPDTGDLIGQPLTGHTQQPETVAFSPNGRLIASGANDGTVRLWDVATGSQLAKLDGHTNAVNSVVFSPDGHRLISGSYDGTVRIWDVDAHKEIATLVGHSGRVAVVAYSPKGTYIASGGEDGTIRLWNVDKRQPVGSPLTTDTVFVQALAFSPDGTELASAGNDDTYEGNVVHLWPFPGDAKTGDLQKTLCSKIPTNMSHTQWKEWVSPDTDIPYPATPPCHDLPVPAG